MDASNDQSVASTAATNQHRSHVSIDDLPPDVLLVIFREVLLTVRQPTFEGFFPVGWNDQHLDPWPSYHNLMSPHPFPESIASVCRHWRGVMSTVAFFWTRLVIWVGRDPTPLSTVCDYIAWSQNSPLDIHVLCTPEESIEHHTTEKAQVQAVMETLTPHMKRWRVLHMQLFFASSLPRPRIDLVGRASKLVELELLSTVDDCVASAEEAPPIVGEFQTPALDVLELSGLQFRESYVKPFPQLPMPPILSYVIVSDYGSQYTPFPLVDLLRCLVSCKGLQHVEFANLHLDCSYNGPPLVQHGITWDAEVVDFLDMRGDVIAHYNRLLGYPYVEAVSYTRCSMEVPCMLGNSYYTRLTEIATSRALFSFLAAGRGPFSCRDVTLTNCDGLRPEVLHMLGLTTDGVWLCPYIKSLTIVGCKQFHSPALRFLLEGRRRVHEATGFPEDIDPQYVVGSIEDLDVKDCCELTPEDKAWLDANVSNVRWDDWSGGYSSRRSR